MNGDDVEFEGTELKLGRAIFIVPPLGLGAAKRLVGRIADFGKLPIEEQMDLAGEMAYLALKRNYPDLTRERVDDLVDLGNMNQVFEAVAKVSGFTAQRVPAGNSPGETAGSTGLPSTPT